MWWLRQPEDSCQPLLLRLIRTHLSASPFKLVPWVLGHLPDPVLQGASCSETKSPWPSSHCCSTQEAEEQIARGRGRSW